MSDPSTYHILIAEDNNVSRDMMASILKTKGYQITGARDGGEAIELIDTKKFDLALVDINMAPRGGFEITRHILVQGIELPVVIITSDESSDLLFKANEMGVKSVLQKPVLPDRLIHTVQRVFDNTPAKGQAFATEIRGATNHDDMGLMLRAIELAVENASQGKGRAFGAVVADKNGYIVGEGVNSFSPSFDPVGLAEIMAIRKATDKLQTADLSGCKLYTSSEPTMIAKALILSVNLSNVFYALSYDNIVDLRNKETLIRDELQRENPKTVEYKQLGYKEACNAFSIKP